LNVDIALIEKVSLLAETGGFMRRACNLLVLASFLLTSSAGFTQPSITIQSGPISHVSNCINSAIESGTLTKDGTEIRFECKRDVARRFYNFLHNKRTFVENYNGVYRTRYLSNAQVAKTNQCYQKVENSEGDTVEGVFVCWIYLSIGDFINE
jgi:hypothetical protein